MADSQKTVFTDDEIAPQVIDIVKNARREVIIISAYLKLWQNAKRALELAAKRGVQVTVILRSKDGVPENPEDIPWLLNNGIQVRAVDSLHAKIYLNETQVFVTSMNLHEASMKGSLEIGLAVQNEAARQQIRNYIADVVMPLANPVSTLQTEPKQLPVHRPGQAHPQSQAVMATCIRCGRPVPPDPSKPLCDDCYDVWADYGDEDYPEKFCLVCGKSAEVTYSKPLCRECFRKLRSI